MPCLGWLIAPTIYARRKRARQTEAKTAEAEGLRRTKDGGYIMLVDSRARRIWAPNVPCAPTPIAVAASPRWAQTPGGPGYDIIGSVQSTSDGGYLLMGRTGSYGAGTLDAWCAKADATGTPAWQRTYGAAGGDSAAAVRFLPAEGSILAGLTSAGATADMVCVKWDNLGNIVWERKYGGTGLYGAAGPGKHARTGDETGWLPHLHLAGRTRNTGSFLDPALATRTEIPPPGLAFAPAPKKRMFMPCQA